MESSYKFLISTTFHKLFNIPNEDEGYIIFIDWVRGSKKGSTAISKIKQNQVVFENIEIILPSTIFYNTKTQKFYKKILEIKTMIQSEKDYNEKKPAITLGSFAIPLHEKAIPNMQNENVYPLTEIVKKNKK